MLLSHCLRTLWTYGRQGKAAGTQAGGRQPVTEAVLRVAQERHEGGHLGETQSGT